jgi:hypothetical protein
MPAEVGEGRSRDRRIRVTDGFELWFKRTAHQIEALMAVTNLAQTALINGIAAVRSSADVIGTTADDGRQWLAAHPCPDTEVGDRFERLLDRYSDVALLFEGGSEEHSTGHAPSLTHEVGALSGDLTDFIADVQSRLGG